MNIFIIDTDPVIAAQQQCDKHVVKMVTESVQLLCDALIMNGLSAPYKKNNVNHPCSIWTRTTIQNYQWVWTHGNALGEEYTRRYGKIHKSHSTLLNDVPYEIDLPKNGLTSFVNCTPYKDELDVVKAYRKFYCIDKKPFAKWKHGNVPVWFVSDVL